MSDPPPKSRKKRMTGHQRREQLLDIGRRLFAERGFDGTSIEEVASQAGVSKPVVYEHFGGKEGLYAVVVDREMQRLLELTTGALNGGHSRHKLERAALVLLRYIEESTDGFRILVRDSHAASGRGTFASLLSDIAGRVEHILGDEFRARGYDPKLAPMYAQMLVGMVALTGQWWLEVRKPKREQVAAHLVNLAWNGLAGLEPKPRLSLGEDRREPDRVKAKVRSKERDKAKDKTRDKDRSKSRTRGKDTDTGTDTGTGTHTGTHTGTGKVRGRGRGRGDDGGEDRDRDPDQDGRADDPAVTATTSTTTSA